MYYIQPVFENIQVVRFDIVTKKYDHNSQGPYKTYNLAVEAAINGLTGRRNYMLSQADDLKKEIDILKNQLTTVRNGSNG